MSLATGPEDSHQRRRADVLSSLFADHLMPGEKLLMTAGGSIWKTVIALILGILFSGVIGSWLYSDFLAKGSLELACPTGERGCAKMYFHSFWMVPACGAFVLVGLAGLALLALGQRKFYAITNERLLLATIGHISWKSQRIEALEIQGVEVKRGIGGVIAKNGFAQFPLHIADGLEFEFIRCIERIQRGRAE